MVDSTSSMIKKVASRIDGVVTTEIWVITRQRMIKRLRKNRKSRGTNDELQFKPMLWSYRTTKMGDTRFANLKLRTSHKFFWRGVFAAILFANMLRFLPSAESARLKWWNGLDWKRENCKMKRLSHDFLVFSASTSDADQHVILVKLIRHVRLPSLFFRFRWERFFPRLRILKNPRSLGGI